MTAELTDLQLYVGLVASLITLYGGFLIAATWLVLRGSRHRTR